jgi:chemotaxis signal transduction protein
VLVVESNRKSLGLGVDEVLDLVEVAPTALDEREALPGVDPRLARAVGRAGDRVFVMLDVDSLLAPLLG